MASRDDEENDEGPPWMPRAGPPPAGPSVVDKRGRRVCTGTVGGEMDEMDARRGLRCVRWCRPKRNTHPPHGENGVLRVCQMCFARKESIVLTVEPSEP